MRNTICCMAGCLFAATAGIAAAGEDIHWSAPASGAGDIRIEPISFTTEGQEDSHGIRLFQDGNYGLVADRYGDSVLCFDVSDPADMRLVSTLKDDRTRGVHYMTVGPNERYGYACANENFTIVDLADPEALRIAGHVEAEGSFTQEIAVLPTDDYAFWPATGAHTLYAVDIRDKSAPKVVGQLSGAGAPNYFESVAHLTLHPSEPILYATSYRDHHVASIDVSDPANMRLLDSTGDHLNSPHELVYHEGYLYIGTMYDNDAPEPREDGALVVYDARDPEALQFAYEIRAAREPAEHRRPFDMLHGLRLDKERKLLFASSQKNNETPCTALNSALSVFDVREPARPRWLGSLQSCTWLDGAQQVDFHGDVLFTGNHDVSSVASFRLHGFLTRPPASD